MRDLLEKKSVFSSQSSHTFSAYPDISRCSACHSLPCDPLLSLRLVSERLLRVLLLGSASCTLLFDSFLARLLLFCRLASWSFDRLLPSCREAPELT
jgi:hypothetical protein